MSYSVYPKDHNQADQESILHIFLTEHQSDYDIHNLNFLMSDHGLGAEVFHYHVWYNGSFQNAIHNNYFRNIQVCFLQY